MIKLSFILCVLMLPLIAVGDALAAPAARSGDMHVCPMLTVLVPHVGGPVGPGSPNVLICGAPAAREGDPMLCVGPPDTIARGSGSVQINGKKAATLGSMSAHGGTITSGCPAVQIAP